ncbi:MAG: formate dehydrogenase accessory sulfurtransferase FdhD [Desulfobacterales bacterium]
MDHITQNSIHWDHDLKIAVKQNLIAEEPLSIRIQGKPYAVVMRTPGDEIAHAAGFCLSEGIVETPDDFSSLGFCDEIEGNVVTVTLTPQCREKVLPILDRKGFVSQTSCGICGKEIIEDLFQIVRPMNNKITIDVGTASGKLDSLSDLQPLRNKTRAAHAAALYDRNMELLSIAEDVGRHNALDKAIGKLFLDQKLEKACLLILSSRISYELVQKAARARISVILAQSKPTALAVELAKKLNMTLASRARGSGLFIFCGPERLSDFEEDEKQLKP